MTETNKTTTRAKRGATRTSKATQPKTETVDTIQVVQEQPKVEVKVEPTVPKRQSIAKIDLNDLVPVVSMIDKVFFVADNTKAEYEWSSKGEVQYITYSELVSMKGRQKRFLDDMWLYIDDEEVVQALNLSKVYEQFHEVKSVQDYIREYSSNYELEQVLKTLPNAIKKFLGRQASQLIQDKQLDSYNSIKTLQNALGVELLHLLD